MQLLQSFLRMYPAQSALLVFALLLVGVIEGISISALLPLLNLVIPQQSPDAASPENGASGDDDGFAEAVNGILLSTGITPSIGVLLTIIVIGITLKNLVLLFANKRIGYIAAQITTDLRLELLGTMMSSRWSYFVHKPIGRLANSMATEAVRASDAYVQAVAIMALLIQAAVYTTVALLVSWKATLICLVAGAFILLVSQFLVTMARRAGKRQTRLLISLLTRFTDTLQSLKALKAMARENLASSVLFTETEKLNRALQKQVFSKAALNSMQEPMFAIAIAAGMFAALEYWGMPFATVVVLVLFLGRVLNYLGKIQKQFQRVMACESAFWSIRETIDEAKHAEEDFSQGLVPDLKSGINLDDIDLAYGEHQVLKNLCMDIPAGSLTTLIGTSGTGKTTVVDLIIGLHRPQSGQVRIDGIPLSRHDLKAWRRKIGYVPQENLLLHDTVFTNVTLGDPALEASHAEDALRAAGAWDFVAALPAGMNTVVGERGTRLSGGQRQRIMIARALAHRPRLLILDEATSALDPKNEAAISDTLKRLRGRLTILAVSHQSALVDVADRVYRIKNGKAILTSENSVSTVDALQSSTGLD